MMIVINFVDVFVVWGNDVLLVDFDQQGNVIEGVGLKDDYELLELNIGDVLIDDDFIDVCEVICDCEGFDVFLFYVDFDDIEDCVWNLMFGMFWVCC